MITTARDYGKWVTVDETRKVMVEAISEMAHVFDIAGNEEVNLAKWNDAVNRNMGERLNVRLYYMSRYGLR